MSRRQALLLVCLLVPLAATGCRVRPFWLRKNQVELPPEVFTQSPTLDDVIDVVNANTSRVRQLQTENATLRAEGIPTLRANIAYEQPRNFRLRAQLSQFTGSELDIGSNNDLFWLWVKRDEQPAVYYARHAEFATSPARDLVPIEPNQLTDALGLIHLSPDDRHSGPTRRENLLEIRSQIPSPRGDMTRVLLVDAKYGWMVEQHFYDANGQLLLSARASEHRYYPENAVTMPHHIEIRLSPGQPTHLAFDLDVGRYIFNRLAGDPNELWAMPQKKGFPSIDIAAPQFRPKVAAVRPNPYGAGGGYAPPSYDALSRGAVVPPDPLNAFAPATAGGIPRSVYGPPRTAAVPAYRGYR